MKLLSSPGSDSLWRCLRASQMISHLLCLQVWPVQLIRWIMAYDRGALFPVQEGVYCTARTRTRLGLSARTSGRLPSPKAVATSAQAEASPQVKKQGRKEVGAEGVERLSEGEGQEKTNGRQKGESPQSLIVPAAGPLALISATSLDCRYRNHSSASHSAAVQRLAVHALGPLVCRGISSRPGPREIPRIRVHDHFVNWACRRIACSPSAHAALSAAARYHIALVHLRR